MVRWSLPEKGVRSQRRFDTGDDPASRIVDGVKVPASSGRRDGARAAGGRRVRAGRLQHRGGRAGRGNGLGPSRERTAVGTCEHTGPIAAAGVDQAVLHRRAGAVVEDLDQHVRRPSSGHTVGRRADRPAHAELITGAASPPGPGPPPPSPLTACAPAGRWNVLMIGADTTMPPAAAAFRRAARADLDPEPRPSCPPISCPGASPRDPVDPASDDSCPSAQRSSVPRRPLRGPTLPAPCTSARTAPSTTPSA